MTAVTTRDGEHVEVAMVPDHPGYAVSATGRVFSCVKPGATGFYDTWRELKPTRTGSRRQYHTVYLGQGRRWDIHRLVMFVFVGPCPTGQEVRHLNDDPRDNRLENLAYGTRAENMADAIRNDRTAKGERNGQAILDENQVRLIRTLLTAGVTQTRIAEGFRVSVEAVSQISRRVRWGWLA